MTRSQPTAIAASLVALLLVSAAPASLAAHTEDEETRIGVVDSGIRASHETFHEGQVTAWRDFVHDKPVPYDDHGHGTAVASMAAGQDTDRQTPSHAPGTSLVVAKVLTDDGARWSDTSQAIDWAREQGADVITLSIYSYQPRPGTDAASGYSQWENMLFDAIERAIDHGVFVTILAGNGMMNSCLPTTSWLHPPASAPALIVGGADANGLPATPCSSMEPEVTAPYAVDVADPACDACYRSWQGTSFSTPLVAGIGAQVVDAADEHGLDADPELVEDAIKFAAEDTLAPPTLEGYGVLDEGAVDRAKAQLPDPGPQTPAEHANQAYVENVQHAQRDTWFTTHR